MEKLIKKIADFSGWKKYLLILGMILSFALLKSFNAFAMYSVNGVFLSLLLILASGFFYWLIFELLVNFFYSGLKPKIEKNININQFINIFRFIFIIFNILLFFLYKILILINFYTIFIMLFLSIILSFLVFIYIFSLLKKYYLAQIFNKDLCVSYFSFVFVYLFLQTVMWGVL